jgi:hypothetical protein
MGYPHQCIRSNRSIDVQRVRTSNLPEDLPVSLQTAKEWLKMAGIDDDDALIQELISEAVDWLEEYCGLSIVPQTITAYLIVKNRIELPYGPVNTITSVNDAAYDPLTSTCNLFNPSTGFVNISGYGTYTVEYEAGYTVVPPALIGAIKAYVAYAYEHRGDDFDETSTEFVSTAAHKAFPFTRNMVF